MVPTSAQAQGTPSDVGDPLLGRVLNDKFRILEAIGAGGMGRVYKAVQSPLERLVALKVLNSQYSDAKDPGFQKRFFLEAAVTSKLRHPNTVTVIDYGKTDDGVLYIAMEYLEGQTLSQLLIQQGPLPWMRVLSITQQVARSLREAHKAGLTHRDLKPANIMVLNQEDDHDVVKVLDFGLVKSFLPDRGGGPHETEITQAGVILGSPQYMAPEQARNVSDPRSDVYSLGVVMFQMLVGRPPFQAAQSIDVIFKHINEAPPTFAAVWPKHTVPAEVEALVMRCLFKRPEERFQSMDEVMEAIRRAAAAVGFSGAFSSSRQFATASGLTPLPPGVGSQTGSLSSPGSTGSRTLSLSVSDMATPPSPPAPARRTLPWVLFGGSLLLGLGVVATFALRASTPPPAPTPATAPVPAVAVAPVPKPPEPKAPVTEPPPAAALPAASAANTPEDLEVPGLVEPTPKAQATGSEVIFRLRTDPVGAKVFLDGRPLGVLTPYDLRVRPNAHGHASAKLSFTLGGFQRIETSAAGDGPVVEVQQKFKKKAESRPPPDSGPFSKYKKDPYRDD